MIVDNDESSQCGSVMTLEVNNWWWVCKFFSSYCNTVVRLYNYMQS